MNLELINRHFQQQSIGGNIKAPHLWGALENEDNQLKPANYAAANFRRNRANPNNPSPATKAY
jgi:hypothetical protein